MYTNTCTVYRHLGVGRPGDPHSGPPGTEPAAAVECAVSPACHLCPHCHLQTVVQVPLTPVGLCVSLWLGTHCQCFVLQLADCWHSLAQVKKILVFLARVVGNKHQFCRFTPEKWCKPVPWDSLCVFCACNLRVNNLHLYGYKMTCKYPNVTRGLWNWVGEWVIGTN